MTENIGKASFGEHETFNIFSFIVASLKIQRAQLVFTRQKECKRYAR